MSKECLHEKLYFGSGDYYIFCETCPRWWVMCDSDHNPTPEDSNIGNAAKLSGETRKK